VWLRRHDAAAQAAVVVISLCTPDRSGDLASGLRAGQQDRALLEALKRCGQLLSALQLPQDRDGNELPDAPHVP
jgi:hypothetical protein